MKPRLTHIGSLLAMAILSPATGTAATFTWDGGSGADSNIATAANWNPDGVPVSDGTADLVFTGATRLTPVLSTGWAVKSITFASYAGANAFTIGGGQTITLGTGGINNNDTDTQTFNDALSIGAGVTTSVNGTSGTIVLNNAIALGSAAAVLNSTGTVTVNDSITGFGTVNKTGSGTLILAGAGDTRSYDLTVAGTVTLAHTGTATYNSTGSVTINSGTLNINGDLTLDNSQLSGGASGIMTLAAGKTLNVTNGTHVTLGGGFTQSTASTINITGSGSTFTTGSNTFDFRGGGAVNVTAGGTLSAWQYLDIGNTANGTVIVDGAGSSMIASVSSNFLGVAGGVGSLTIRNAASGSLGGYLIAIGTTAGTQGNLRVESGATVTLGGSTVAESAASTTGSIVVTGTGSTLTQTGSSTLMLGAASLSSATLTAASGGTFTSGTGQTTVNATGTININGGTYNANGNMVLNGTLNCDATGSFSLAAGKTLTVQNGGDFLSVGGHSFNSAANVVVTGSGSTLMDSYRLGFGGGNVTTVQSGGLVSTDFCTIGVSSNGTVIVDGGTFNTTGASGLQLSDGGATGSLTYRNAATGSLRGVFMGSTIVTGSSAILALESGATVTADNIYMVSTSITGSASLSVSGTGTTLTQNGTSALTLGAASLSSATLTAASGGTFTSGTGQTTVNATGTINITGGTYNANGNMVLNGTLNRDATGTFSLAAGKTLTIQNGGDFLSAGGHGFNSSSNVLVTGSGSTLIDANSLSFSGGNVTTVQSGGLVSTAFCTIGVSSNGTVIVDGGAFSTTGASGLQLSDGGATGSLTYRNAATGSLRGVFMGSTIVSGSSAFLTLESGATVTADNIYMVSTSLTQSASLSVSGTGTTLTQNGASALTLGAAAASTATMTVTNGGTFTSGTGSFTVNPTGTVNIDGGTLTVNGAFTNRGTFNFSSGTLNLSGPNNLTVGTGGLLGNDLTLTSTRTLSVAGTTTIDATRTLSINGGTFRTGTLTNNGTLDFEKGTLGITGAGGLTIGSGVLGSTVTLGSGANLEVANTTTIAAGALLRVDGGGFSGNAISNSGTLDHRDGTLNFSGTLMNNSAGRVFVSGIAAPAGNISNAGRITLQDGLGLLGGAGTLTNTSLVTGDGTITRPVTNGATGTIRAEAGKTLAITGTFAANAGTLALDGGTLDFANAITNSATGFISGRGSLYTGGLTNSGVMAFSGGITDIHGDVVLSSGSRVVTAGAGSTTTFFDDVVHNGTEIFTGAGASTVFFGSQTGAGAFTGTGTIYYIGDLRPGNSPATVNYGGNVVLSESSRITIELGGLTRGLQYDSLNLAGSIQLHGTLDLVSINGFTPAAGNIFDITDAAAINGTFDSIVLPTLGSGLTWDTSQLYTSGQISVDSTLTPIEQWRQLHFGSPADSGDGANNNDFDHDGTANLLEYALGLDPRNPDPASGLPAVGTVTVGANRYLSLTFTRPLSATDITYQVEVSGDLGAFLPGSLYTAAGNVPTNTHTTEYARGNDGIRETITVRDNTPLTGTPARFLRLRVSQP